jgi:FixJ family two-component response regulator
MLLRIMINGDRKVKVSGFYQVDADFRRRARFTLFARFFGVHSEPFESVEEMMVLPPHDGVLFVADGGDRVARAGAAITASGRWMPLVAYDAEPRVERVVDAMRSGAIDYFGWPFEPDRLSHRIEDLLSRAEAIREEANHRARAQKMVAALSPREAEVLCALAEGGSNKSIAQELDISPRTVEIHRANMMGKLGLSSSAAAVKLAIEADMLSERRAAATPRIHSAPPSLADLPPGPRTKR